MRKLLLFIYILIVNLNAIYGQNLKSNHDYFFPNINQNNSEIDFPPGTVKLNDSLFIDFAPVDTKMYQEFLLHIQRYWSLPVSDSLSKLPVYGLNRTIFNRIIGNFPIDYTLLLTMTPNEKMLVGSSVNMTIYMNHPKYYLFPMVNISKEQAELFCKWRTDAVKIRLAILNKIERNNFPLNFLYRLPTANELKMVVDAFGYTEPLKQINREIPFSPYQENQTIKNNIIIINKNNISEYTLTDEIFGENWRNKSDIKNANDYLGFRCVCEIIK